MCVHAKVCTNVSRLGACLLATFGGVLQVAQPFGGLATVERTSYSELINSAVLPRPQRTLTFAAAPHTLSSSLSLSLQNRMEHSWTLRAEVSEHYLLSYALGALYVCTHLIAADCARA